MSLFRTAAALFLFCHTAVAARAESEVPHYTLETAKDIGELGTMESIGPNTHFRMYSTNRMVIPAAGTLPGSTGRYFFRFKIPYDGLTLYSFTDEEPDQQFYTRLLDDKGAELKNNKGPENEDWSYPNIPMGSYYIEMNRTDSYVANTTYFRAYKTPIPDLAGDSNNSALSLGQLVSGATVKRLEGFALLWDRTKGQAPTKLSLDDSTDCYSWHVQTAGSLSLTIKPDYDSVHASLAGPNNYSTQFLRSDATPFSVPIAAGSYSLCLHALGRGQGATLQNEFVQKYELVVKYIAGADDPGDTPDTAFDLGVLNDHQTVTGAIGADGDRNDLFSVIAYRNGNLTTAISGLQEPVTIGYATLVNGKLAFSYQELNPSTQSRNFVLPNVVAGQIYYIRIAGSPPRLTQYRLDVSN